MANKIRHLLHRRSLKSSPFIVNIERDTLEVQNPKAPFAENIEYGELAVNYGKGHEGLFLRNSENEVIQLNTMKHIRYDGAVDKSFEKYLDDRYVNRSGDTMYGDFTITKDWDTDDPKFRYIGSYFLIDSEDTDISGNTLDMIENTTTIDIETGFTNIKEHKYEGIKLDADVNNTNWSGNTLVLEESVSISAKTPTFTLSSTTANIIGLDNLNLSGKTTYMSGVTLDVNYQNVDLSGSTDIDIVSPIINIDASNLVDISGAVEVHIDSVNGTVDIDGKTTTMDGDLLQVTYKNIDIKGTSDIDIVSPDIDIDVTDFTLSGTTTNLKGTTFNENYTNINRTATTVTNNVTNENDNFTTWNLSATTNNFQGTDWNINYENINLTATTNNNTITTQNNTYGTVNTTATTVNENINKWNVTATTNHFEGDSWTIDYDNLNLSATTTTFQGDTLNEYYKNINRTANTINTTATTENNYVDTTNFYGDVNIQNDFHVSGDSIFEGDVNIKQDFHVSGDSIFEGDVNISGDTIVEKNFYVSGDTNIAGDTHIYGDLILEPGQQFNGELLYKLKFDSAEQTDQTYDNTKDVTIKYVDSRGDTMSGKLTISSGGLAVVGNSTFDGTIDCTSAIYSSDKDLKENVKKINKYDIATVADVELKSYKFIDDETHRERYGVIAQDLESVGLEHLVVTKENGKKGVDYISFLILKIAQLEKEIEELRNKK